MEEGTQKEGEFIRTASKLIPNHQISTVMVPTSHLYVCMLVYTLVCVCVCVHVLCVHVCMCVYVLCMCCVCVVCACGCCVCMCVCTHASQCMLVRKVLIEQPIVRMQCDPQ